MWCEKLAHKFADRPRERREAGHRHFAKALFTLFTLFTLLAYLNYTFWTPTHDDVKLDDSIFRD